MDIIPEIFYNNFGWKGKGAATRTHLSTDARCKRNETARGFCCCKTIDWNRIDLRMHLPGRVRGAGDVATRSGGAASWPLERGDAPFMTRRFHTTTPGR